MTPTLMSATEAAALPVLEEASFGCLATDRGHLPLEAMDVQATVTGLFATTRVAQTFRNAFQVPLEATYIFPLPDRGAVTAFRLDVAGRTVEGTLAERGEARRAYDEALAAGHRAAIAEEERPGTFTMRVGNLPAGERATVHLELTGPLALEGAEATYRFPLVVAPRYIPGAPLPGESVGSGAASDTDAVPDASRVTPPVLLPGFPNPVRLSLAVQVEPSGVPVHDVTSSLHLVAADADGAGWRVRLEAGARLDRDFVLRLRLADEALRASVAAAPDPDGAGGTFALTLLPPPAVAGRPRDVAIVLDRSGSMGGWKMLAARRAAARIVDTLGPDDRIAVIAFDNSVESPATGLVAATDRNRFHAVQFLAGIEARGGTEMAGPLLDAAARLAHAPRSEADRVLVLVTDGQVGNEDQLLAALARVLDDTRVFAVGVDQAVNEGFLRRLAALGGGGAEIVESEARLDAVLDRIHRQIGTPALTGLAIEGAAFAVLADTLVPQPLPSVFEGAPVVVLGRFEGDPTGTLLVHGTRGDGTKWSSEVAVEAVPEERSVFACAWARGRIRSLEDAYIVHGHPETLEREIVATSLRFGVLSRFTAFVAVDIVETVDANGTLHRVTQPVEVPAGWEMYPAEALVRFSAPASTAAPMLLSMDAGGVPTGRIGRAFQAGTRPGREPAAGGRAGRELHISERWLGEARLAPARPRVTPPALRALRDRARALVDVPPATLALLTRAVEALLYEVRAATPARVDVWQPLADLLARLRAGTEEKNEQEQEQELRQVAASVLTEFANGEPAPRTRFWAKPPGRPGV